MDNPETLLIRAAAQLDRSSHAAYALFIKALEGRVEKLKDLAISASKDDVFTAQGRAQEAIALCKTLRDANAKANQLDKPGG